MQQQDQNPYGFILDSNQKSKPSLPLPNTSSTKGRILLVVGVATILIIAASLLFSFLGKAGKSDVEALTKIAQTQTELIRISGLTADKAKINDSYVLGHTVASVIMTDNQAIVALIKKQGVKVDAKILALRKDTAVDAELDTANRNNTFDEAYTAALKEKLAEYQALLAQQYAKTSSKTERQLLNDANDHIVTILDATKASK